MTRPSPLEAPDPFEIAGGSVAGRHHRCLGRPNQDVYTWLSTPRSLVALVCDGCGSSRSSELGARLGGRLVAASLTRLLGAQDDPPPSDVLERTHREVIARLALVAGWMGPDTARVVADHFLFTIVGCFVTRARACVFSLGDGLAAVNGEWIRIGPFPDDAPPYLGHALGGGDERPFVVHRIIPSAEVETILLGSDGVLDLAAAQARSLPGRSEPVGPLSAFWTDDRYFANPDMVRRRLELTARSVTRAGGADVGAGPARESGLLPDDTTIVVVRRRRRGVVAGRNDVEVSLNGRMG